MKFNIHEGKTIYLKKTNLDLMYKRAGSEMTIATQEHDFGL